MVSVKIIVGLAIVLILILLAMAGSFNFLFSMFTTSTTLKATSVSTSTLTWSVVQSDPINSKEFGGFDRAFTTDVVMQGDSDLPTSQVVCDKWGGGYSATQGRCDIRLVPNNAEVSANNLKMRSTTVNFNRIQNGMIFITLPSALQMGCTEQMFFDDNCRGSVSGSITFSLPEVPIPPDEEFCGDGICQFPESNADCPEDCPAGPPPPGPPPAADPTLAVMLVIIFVIIVLIAAFMLMR